MARKKNKVWLWLIPLLLVVGVGLYFLIGSGLFQSVLSVSSSVQVSGGKAYWLVSGVGDSVDEGFQFSFSPKDVTLSDGSVVKPTRDVTLYFSKGVSKCVYSLEQQVVSKNFYFIFPVNFYYYGLRSPSRVATVNVRDSLGNSVVFDSVSQSSFEFKDKDGVGSVVVQSIGRIPTDHDCPEYGNVAIVYSKDGVPIYYDRTDLVSKLNGMSLGTDVFSIYTMLNFVNSHVRLATDFVNGFDSAPVISGDKSSVSGGLDVGSILWSATADQDYFNSVVVIPPVTAKPSIDSLVVGDVKTGSVGTIKVSISNQNEGSGKVSLRLSITRGSISGGGTYLVSGSQDYCFSRGFI